MNRVKERGQVAPHLVRVDVLRAYAILLVFLVHFISNAYGLVVWKGWLRDYGLEPYDNYGLVPLTYGWMGVALFFVISGFCIHYAFLRQPAGNFMAANFFWRRFVRLYPAYLVSLLVLILCNYLYDPTTVTAWGVISHFFFFHNLSIDNFGSINGVYWSLGVEVQFYLLYPPLLWLRSRCGLSLCLALALLLHTGCYVAVSLISPDAGFHVDPYRSFPLMTWCDWVLGACLAEAFIEKKRCLPHARLFLFLSLALLIASMNFKPLIGEAFLFASVFFAIVLQDYIACQEPLNWREKALVPLGLASYSFYLWHASLLLPVRDMIHAVFRVPETPIVSLMTIYLPLSFLTIGIFSLASYYVLEVGGRRLLTGCRRSRLL